MNLRIKKTYIFACLNLLFFGLYLFLLLGRPFDFPPVTSVVTFFDDYGFSIILIFFLLWSSCLSVAFLTKKVTKQNISLYRILTIVHPLLFLLVFIGYFFLANFYFFLVLLVVPLLLYYYAHKVSKKLAIFLSVISLCLSALLIVSELEESYCLKKGVSFEKQIGKSTMTATKEDETQLPEYVKAGSMVGTSFLAHMKCHRTYDLFQAVKESYLLMK